MSSTQVTEGPKFQVLSIGIIKAKLAPFSPLSQKYKTRVSFGPQTWETSSVFPQHNKIHTNEYHVFGLSDANKLEISLMRNRFLLGSYEIGHSSIYINSDFKRSTEWYRLEWNGKAVGKVLISIGMDELSEICSFTERILCLELEKTKIRFFKEKYIAKIRVIKGTKIEFRKNADNCIIKLKECVDEVENSRIEERKKREIGKEKGFRARSIDGVCKFQEFE
jgi:hypothetical protein